MRAKPLSVNWSGHTKLRPSFSRPESIQSGPDGSLTPTAEFRKVSNCENRVEAIASRLEAIATSSK